MVCNTLGEPDTPSGPEESHNMAKDRRGQRRIMRLASDATLNGVCLVAKRSLWTPSLCKYLQAMGVCQVHIEMLDGFGRVIESETIAIGESKNGEIYTRPL